MQGMHVVDTQQTAVWGGTGGRVTRLFKLRPGVKRSSHPANSNNAPWPLCTARMPPCRHSQRCASTAGGSKTQKSRAGCPCDRQRQAQGGVGGPGLALHQRKRGGRGHHETHNSCRQSRGLAWWHPLKQPSNGTTAQQRLRTQRSAVGGCAEHDALVGNQVLLHEVACALDGSRPVKPILEDLLQLLEVPAGSHRA